MFSYYSRGSQGKNIEVVCHSLLQGTMFCLFTSRQIEGETMETVTDFILGDSKITADGDCSHEIKRHLLLGRKVTTNLDSILKNQRHYFTTKGPSSQTYGFSSSHVWMWELNYKESWVPKNWRFWTDVVYSVGEGSGTHSSSLAWKIPWTAKPGGLQSMGSLRVGHDWATSLSLFTFTHWRRK